MKEFQNWWEKEYSWRIENANYPCPEIYAEEAWKAALRWVWTEIDGCCDRFELSDKIDEELEDE